ncbi:MAG TPA: hypothetical protein VFD36_28720 [Kofleriaceae bacterium]|nr:hypothetical protein [Kofleriaceae bacterium]
MRAVVTSGLLEAEVSDCRGDAPRACERRLHEDVEILGEAWPAVRCQSVGADEQEPDAMALQRAEKLVPFG